MESSLTIVILAAGMGTRMKSERAKVLHEAGGKTLIAHVVDTALRLTDAGRIFVVVGHQAELVQAALQGRNVNFVLQKEQNGTGHALLVGREVLEPLEGDLAVLYGDCPLITAATISRLRETHSASHGAATVITALVEDPSGYGRIIRDPAGNISQIVEHRAASEEQLAVREINSGIYCFQSALFWKHIDRIQPDNPAKELYLTDVIGLLHGAGHAVAAMQIEDPAEVFGINTRIELADVDQIFRQRKIRQLMLDGVTIQKPDTVTVDEDVRIGRDVIVGPFAQILGSTEIGEGSEIGACSILKDCRLAKGVTIAPFTMMESSTIEAGAVLGPYARLRPGNHIEAGAKVGNFVELKKTRLGARSKANHLSYLGDSTIGSGVNIGAGTITCNYDGTHKHGTVIGDGAFVGSHTTLVAPVNIGEGSYLGAGSVITEQVPPGALALGRSRQTNKDGWVEKRRKK